MATPRITTHPRDNTRSVGQTARFLVIATGSPAPTYVWKKNGTNIPGATGDTYTTPALTAADNGAVFKVEVRNRHGRVVSNGARLTVNAAPPPPVPVPTAPTITTQPANATKNVGETATFTVAVTGAAPTFQWKKNGADIPGATSRSYTTPALTAADNGAVFKVEVRNTVGNVMSNGSTLTVNPAPAPAPAHTRRPVHPAVWWALGFLGLCALCSMILYGSRIVSNWARSLAGTEVVNCIPTQADADKGIKFNLEPGDSRQVTDKEHMRHLVVCVRGTEYGIAEVGCEAGYVPQDGGGCVKPVAQATEESTAPEAPAPADPSGNVDVGNPPFATIVQQDENGRSVTTLAGFDLGEYGGDDSGCTRTGDPEYVHIGEVVGSQSEKCLSVIEWSLKVGDQTILAGTYALRPGEWFYIPLAVFGQNDSPRIVGTLYLLPKGWNAHMFAADIAADRDARDGTTSFVGLSPTDPWVVGVANGLK